MWELKQQNKIYSFLRTLSLTPTPIFSRGEADLSMVLTESAFKDYKEVMINVDKHYKGDVLFSDFLEKADSFIADTLCIAERHRAIGTRLDYYLSALKTMRHFLDGALTNSGLLGAGEFVKNMAKVHDAIELAIIGKWNAKNALIYRENQDALKVEIKQTASKLQAVIDYIHYPVFILDKNGDIININEAARNYFALVGEVCSNILDIFDFHSSAFSEYAASYGKEVEKPVRLPNGDRFLSVLLKLNKREYLLSLNRLSKEAAKLDAAQLTQTEKAIFAKVSEGLSSKQIADEFCISVETTKTHRRNIRKKMRVVGVKVNTALPEEGSRPLSQD